MIGKNLRHRWKLLLNSYAICSRFDVLVEKNVTIKYPQALSFGRHCTLQSGVYLYGSRRTLRVSLGDFVTISGNCVLLGEGGLIIGDYTHLGPGVTVTTQFGDSRSPMSVASPHVKTAPVRIGKGCWIGSGSIIMPGTMLGDECIVAPNSVVFGAWKSGTKLSGNPARRVKSGLPTAPRLAS